MSFDPQFKIYVVDRAGFGESPIVITTSYVEYENVIAEWFAIIPTAETKVRMARVGWREPQSDLLTVDSFLAVALLEAEAELDSFLTDKWGDEHSFQPTLREDNSNLFVTLMLRNRNRDELRQVLVNSGCDPLKNALSQCMRLPILRTRGFE